MHRVIDIKTPLGADVLRLHSMHGSEELGRLFDYQITVLSEKNDVDPDKLLGQPITVTLELPDQKTRYFSAYATRLAQVGMIGRFHAYQITARPWLWFMTRVTDCRIFQNKTVPQIIKEVFGKYEGLAVYSPDQLTAKYREWEYCVQYRETTFNFISRLMEQEGIYYYFKHEENKHTMVLADAKSLHTPYPGYDKLSFLSTEQVAPDEEHIHAWHFAREVQPVAYATEEFDFKRPSFELRVKKEVARNHAQAKFEMFDYPGEYVQKTDGEHYAQARIEELHSQFELASGSTNARGLTVGHLVKLAKHPREDQNKQYLVVSANYSLQGAEHETAASEGAAYSCNFTVLDSRQQFRTQRLTPKPMVQGPQTAIVVGPSGDEIYTDPEGYGQVKVQFHWDRYGKSNETSSCWVRVSHPWAGKNFGAIHIPRIGQEVIVDFLEGDPDQPIITGRVYNNEQMPPWPLPANNTQSGILTRSSKGGTPANANAIRFEDKKGAEQVWIHAEKNQDIEVENDETHWVGHDRRKTIDNDETVHVKHDRTETVDHDETITICNNRTENVGVDEKITIGSNRTEKVGVNETIDIGSNRTETVGANEMITVALTRTRNVGINEMVNVGGAQEVTVGGLQAITVGLTRAVTVGTSQSVNIGTSHSVNVGTDESVNVGSNRSESIGADHTVSVGKNQSSSIGENRSASVGKDDSTKVGKNLVIDAGESITIKTGSASISMKKDGTIAISGKDISIKGSGKISVKASSDVVIKGSKVGIN